MRVSDALALALGLGVMPIQIAWSACAGASWAERRFLRDAPDAEPSRSRTMRLARWGAAEAGPFMPVLLVATYLANASLNGIMAAATLCPFLVNMLVWFVAARAVLDGRWTRRRQSLAARLRRHRADPPA